MMPLVSVVMPTHNGERYVASAIRSLQTQDHRHLEILVIDDGSNDGTAAIVEDAAEQDRRIVFIRTHQRSIAGARNLGLARMRGEYVSFLDHDDLCPPGKIRRQVAHLRSNPAAMAVFGRTVMFASAEEDPNSVTREGSVLTIALAAGLFRRETFDLLGPLDSSFKLADDFDFILRLIESGMMIQVEEEVATLHRRHPTQATADIEATRRELNLALARSVGRRRRAGKLAPLDHPLVEALRA